jgi:hypothetical protein
MSVPATHRLILDSLGLLLVIATVKIRFLPKELTAVEFVPFCAFIGGLAGAFSGNILGREASFPKRESFRGAALGALFGAVFIAFGTWHV